MRDKWIENVNHKLEENDMWIKTLDKKIDKNNEDTLSLLIDSKRNTIISFASYVIDENSLVTKEQFNRVLKLYEEYEDIIEKNNRTNGEVDIAYRIIKESYEKHMKNHTMCICCRVHRQQINIRIYIFHTALFFYVFYLRQHIFR